MGIDFEEKVLKQISEIRDVTNRNFIRWFCKDIGLPLGIVLISAFVTYVVAKSSVKVSGDYNKIIEKSMQMQDDIGIAYNNLTKEANKAQKNINESYNNLVKQSLIIAEETNRITKTIGDANVSILKNTNFIQEKLGNAQVENKRMEIILETIELTKKDLISDVIEKQLSAVTLITSISETFPRMDLDRMFISYIDNLLGIDFVSETKPKNLKAYYSALEERKNLSIGLEDYFYENGMKRIKRNEDFDPISMKNNTFGYIIFWKNWYRSKLWAYGPSSYNAYAAFFKDKDGNVYYVGYVDTSTVSQSLNLYLKPVDQDFRDIKKFPFYDYHKPGRLKMKKTSKGTPYIILTKDQKTKN